ncbi:bifunctional phosphoribosylaminoimidazolecarboxamide formyltransferase/IMP cyclohydrolase [Rhodovibrio salinarum]|uniref:Bifunctional purine biosynthesis protein PurH n=1 Tax=Rhodovibrio salinarum TaxID=1087 RepID=A0A934QGS2_9PROT|nr:bifunctional phosphoribosylaminoimidazolecarboxamide formyltransferase/IMP cyclohydrolase [Rhodovibrio salinarum]MBK1696711.1 bifunctional phosphoribosylaminoimidazolecarboxamide formyltransferase/IMP cyclohydrolase PurH [Rhodovibrio salinarum]
MSDTVIQRALLSVSDKRGLVEFASFLSARGVEILSTGGSAKAIREAGLPVTEVAETTEFPEIMDGRVKTLHPRIHGGLLGRRDHSDDRAAMAEHGIPAIDLLVVNLYPFEQTVAGGADRAACIEKIDIGGPAMVRAAAKNHAFVTVVVNPDDYDGVMAEMRANDGALGEHFRRRLAADAYAHTAAYDAAVAEWMQAQEGVTFPRELSIAGRRKQTLRYGENPHQDAAFYQLAGQQGDRPGVATATQLQGKELSYNNLNDTDAAFEAVAEFDDPAVVIVKHANPCGVAVAGGLSDAYDKALACDPVSAFGGIIAVNRTLDAATAEKITELFAEVVIAPVVAAEARSVLATKKNLRVLETGGMPVADGSGLTARTLSGGLLLQTRDGGVVTEGDLSPVTARRPSAQELADLLFAFRVCKHVKSNAIVYAKNGATVGIGAGQMSRVDSARIAVRKSADAAEAAGETTPRTQGAVVASDAFFPFADGLISAAEAGVTAVIQPGGSKRDDEVVAAADARGLAMVFTGMRHFRH